MDPRAQKLTCIDLYDVFPQARRVSSSQPRVQVVPLGFPLHSTVIVHEEIVSLLDKFVGQYVLHVYASIDGTFIVVIVATPFSS